MTAQINDQVFHRKITFSMADISGDGLFEPELHGIKPVSMSSACWRGYYVMYAIEEGQLFLTRVTVGLSNLEAVAARAGRGPQLFGQHPNYEDQWGWVYDNLRQPISFSGGLLLADRFIRELYVHMGFHSVWKYRDVREVLFEQGRLTDDFDRSEEMRGLRQQLSDQPLAPGTWADRKRIKEWMERSFSRDYTKRRRAA